MFVLFNFIHICPLIPAEDSPSPPVIAQVVKNAHQGSDLVPCSILGNTLLTFRNKQTMRVLHVYLNSIAYSAPKIDSQTI
jgi:hypothetical protein